MRYYTAGYVTVVVQLDEYQFILHTRVDYTNILYIVCE